MNTNMKNYLRAKLSPLRETSGRAWACLAVVPLRAGRRWVFLALIAVLYLIPAGRVAAQTFTTLHSFTAGGFKPYVGTTNSDGIGPHAGLILSGNTLYGTAGSGGLYGYGTVFAVNTDGAGFTILHSFAASYEADPQAGLILSGETLYGTTTGSGLGNGTVFKVNTDGTGFTNLRSFYPSSDGIRPQAGLILSGNTLYGTASQGGTSGDGTVFALNTDGTGFTTLHGFTLNFCNVLCNDDSDCIACGGVCVTGNSRQYCYNNNGNGAIAQAGLALSGNTLYGTTYQGGIWDLGTVFAVKTDGTGFTTLHSFADTPYTSNYTNSDGAYPRAGLILSGNTLYGTAIGGGLAGYGTVFSISFRPQLTVTPSGTNIILSWPTNVAGFDYTGYTLQSTTNLVPPAVWSTNSPAPVVVAGRSTVTNPIAGGQHFYRLVQ